VQPGGKGYCSRKDAIESLGRTIFF